MKTKGGESSMIDAPASDSNYYQEIMILLLSGMSLSANVVQMSKNKSMPW